MQAPPSQRALDEEYPARPSEVAAIRRHVLRAARERGADPCALGRIGLAVTEAATNAILHGYRERADPGAAVRVVVRAEDDGVLDVRVRDAGGGPGPRPDSPGLGLGLGLMAHEAERFEIRSAPDGGTEVMLRFRLECERHTARSTSSHGTSWNSHSSARRRSSTTLGDSS